MDENAVRKLDDNQVEAFDTEYVDDERWLSVKRNIDADFPSGEFSFLDVGGGNGMFVDRLLAAYPKSTGTVLDNSELLLARNQPNDRKSTLLDSVENLEQYEERYDVIFVNWLLHHLVGDSFSATRSNQKKTLATINSLLTPRGRVSIFENVYDGPMGSNFPGWMIYQLSSNRLISGITSRLGANTAGIGVCFLSKHRWLDTINSAGLDVIQSNEPDNWEWSMPLSWKICFQIRRRYVDLFWIKSGQT